MGTKIAIGLVMTLILVAFLPVYWLNEPARQAQAQERQKTEAMERGVHIYENTCASCHGEKGQGLVGPALLGTKLDEDSLRKVISRGRGVAMPAWDEEEGGPLKGHQILDLVTFIKNWDESLLSTDKGIAPAAAQPTLGAANSLQEAEKLYATNCAACHGSSRGGGVGPALTSQTLAGKTDEQVRQTISEGKSNTSMPAWKGKLSPEQISALVQFLKSPAK